MPRLLSILLIIAGLMVGMMASAIAQVEIGKPAPEFTLKDSLGHEVSLSQFLGKYLVLEWLNYDCPFVNKHYNSRNMQNLQETYTGKGVVWLSIISSAPGQQGYYEPADVNGLNIQKNASPTAILLDPTGRVGRLYGAKTTPYLLIIDPKGIMIYQGAIDDIPSVNPDDVPKANNYVQAALEEAMAGKAVSVPSTKSYGCSVKYQSL